MKHVQRVEVKIQNLLSLRNDPDNSSNILKTLFRTVRRTAAKDLWARESPEYRKREAQAMTEEGWTADMPRQQAFPLQMRVRAALFAELSDGEREFWEKKAATTKQHEPSAYVL